MPIANVIDRRKHPYRFQNINAVMEPTCQDNSIDDADNVARQGNEGIGYDELEHVTVSAAFQWADSLPFPATLYLYDHDSGIYPIKPQES